jgi:hypothetical protein
VKLISDDALQSAGARGYSTFYGVRKENWLVAHGIFLASSLDSGIESQVSSTRLQSAHPVSLSEAGSLENEGDRYHRPHHTLMAEQLAEHTALWCPSNRPTSAEKLEEITASSPVFSRNKGRAPKFSMHILSLYERIQGHTSYRPPIDRADR